MRLFYAIAMAVALAVCCPACTTVIPQTVTSSQASFDGQEQNSGFVGYAPDGRMIVTEYWRDRYNALIEHYAGRMTVPPKPDFGLTPMPNGQWLVTNQAQVNFLTMNQWRKQGAK